MLCQGAGPGEGRGGVRGHDGGARNVERHPGYGTGPRPLGTAPTQTSAAADVTPTGRTTTVCVVASGVRFEPATITVPPGDRLVIDLVNADEEQPHDLTLDTGAHTPRVAPRAVEGWCSVIGHRQVGMTLAITPAGTAASATASR